MSKFIFRLKCLFFAPLYLFFSLYKDNEKELRRWEALVRAVPYKSSFLCFIRMCAGFPEYRSLYLFRLGGVGEFLSYFVSHSINTFFITKSENIGSGLVLWHGYSTIIFAESVGENCEIWHNVTIGRAHDLGRRPRIGNNVKVCAGAIVLGDIEIGDNVIIGAGAVVTKSIPANSVVVGNPAKIIKTI